MINTFAYINRKARERYEVYSQKDCKYISLGQHLKKQLPRVSTSYDYTALAFIHCI